jgi:hypothetical protein
MGTVVQFPGIAAQKVGRSKRGQSFYDLYPMPFFDKKTRCSWTSVPSDSYAADCRRGRAYAIEFLSSCDGSYGWLTLLGCIVTDMTAQGPARGHWPSGRAKANGLIVGFMAVISRASTVVMRHPDLKEIFLHALDREQAEQDEWGAH